MKENIKTMIREYESTLAKMNKYAQILSQLHTGLLRAMNEEIQRLHAELTEAEQKRFEYAEKKAEAIGEAMVKAINKK